ncbi:hypothetical protein LR48_Vigan205s005900 [Vigna angularis]|uniref:Glucan endo-1,3-beta-glucosidase n=1 Tax=Phaseolus angularis TaxID=3914 RepID=A0A0L9T5R4_PHAAN|nr:Glucan endo-1,3-beta-glucosidase [Vigna angularis]KOM25922.1 hypothetical protein LR48_Vigan205s005900 [Vigna angularis]
MAKSTSSLVFLFIFPLLLSCNNLGRNVKFAYGLVKTHHINCVSIFCISIWKKAHCLFQIQEAQKSWCVAKPSSSDSTLENNIQYACSILGDCKMIQPGGSCFDPNNLLNHASVVMNQYYAFSGGNGWNCYFAGSGLIAVSDPSYDNCKYA